MKFVWDWGAEKSQAAKRDAVKGDFPWGVGTSVSEGSHIIPF